MKAKQATLHEFLDTSRQYRIPIYQRTYSWTEEQCDVLFDDILRIGSADEEDARHFIGSFVYIEEGVSQATREAPYVVIDGQQRLTTIMLLVEAIARFLESSSIALEVHSSELLRNDYLFNPKYHSKKDFYHKLILTKADQETLLAFVNKDDMPTRPSNRIRDNFDHFVTKVNERSSDLQALCDGIYRLTVVDIVLERITDDPQLIFESLNSTGLELSKADLIRNYLLMGLEPDDQKQIYEKYWCHMEDLFGQKAYSEQFDNFIRGYLTVKTDEIPKKDRVYHEFKKYAGPKIQEHDIERVVTDIRNFAGHYYSLVLEQKKDTTLAIALADLRDLKTDVVYPFLLKVYDDYSKDLLSGDDVAEIVRLVESYIFRRWVCGLNSRGYDHMFRDSLKAIDEENYLESVLAHFLLLRDNKRFPTDTEFIKYIKGRDLYNTRYSHYWLYRFENYNKKERVSKGDYTIEHIMPQSEDLSDEWKKSLGDNWKHIHQQKLHTLGNLTLTGYNTEYGNKSFTEKRDMEDGFRDSTLRLNKGLKDVKIWNEQAMTDRADILAQQVTNIWIYPLLSDKIIEKYRPKAQPRKSVHTIDDHPFLIRKGITKDLFSEFRRKVKDIHPCVTEEFLKIYVAYKAETNFVDVIPRAKNLCLSLNIGIDDIRDPENIAIDVAGKGRRGNGDVEVHLRSSDEISYIMDLVQQAFDRQMENGSYTV